ncbi:MAG TPA: hypothetical protein VK595_04560, partial [Vicinamibacterales bacterium]|nr:hypothetical protein [Vicinamibacterales bacterium]
MAQIPFVDLRSFIQDPSTRRLMKPQWPMPIAGHEFVRRFGVVRKDPRGSLLGWAGEEHYCSADKAITFGESPKRSTAFRIHPLYKRLITDGVVGRIELGFRARDTTDYLAVADAIGQIKVNVGKGTVRKLHQAGPAIALLYARSTTALSLGDGHRAGLVLPGAPLTLIERGTPSRGGQGVDAIQRLAIEHQWHWREGTGTALWVLEQDAGTAVWLVRDARVHAMRLHCEYEAFAAILRACISGRILPHESPDLTDYLHSRGKRLLRSDFRSMPQGDILENVATARRSFTEGDIASMEQAFSKVNSSLRRLIRDAAYIPTPATTGQIVEDRPAKYIIRVETGGVVHVTDQNWKFENSTVSGVFGNNAHVEGSQIGDQYNGPPVDLSGLANALLEQLAVLRQDGLAVDDSLELAQVVSEETSKPQVNKGR